RLHHRDAGHQAPGADAGGQRQHVAGGFPEGRVRVVLAAEEHQAGGSKRMPGESGKPRRNSEAARRFPPARCSSVIASREPSPHATPMPCSSMATIVPGCVPAFPGAALACQTLIASPLTAAAAPGAGLKARTRRAMTSAGWRQSIGLSALSILFAYVT